MLQQLLMSTGTIHSSQRYFQAFVYNPIVSLLFASFSITGKKNIINNIFKMASK